MEVTEAGDAQSNRWLVGGGALGELMRSIDWSQTPLGPTETWPESLRGAVRLCLDSRHPIVLWWGPERWMFYNDAYRPMLGESKHPQFLGRSGQACWAEIWHVIGPMMDQVIATGEATWSEDLLLLMRRNNYLEETYFTFSYSPIRDRDGRPRGIFNACSESTARVLANRRLKSLRELNVEARTLREAAQHCAGALGHNAADVPFALVYLLNESAQRLELLGHSGLERGTAAGPDAVELDVDDAGGWPLGRVLARARAEHVDDLDSRFHDLPRAPWGVAPREALLVPIMRPGSQRAVGVLVLGINPMRAFDDDYRGFFDLVGSHVATELSNARAYEEERRRAEALAELDRVKTKFFHNISHEFRTPLTLILGPIEEALASEERALEGGSLEAVHRSAVRLLRLVNSLLDFSRAEAGRLQARFEPTDLAALTAGLAGSFQSLVESAGLTLVIDCASLPEPVYVDPEHWEKIVLNLVSNAFKFTFTGQIAVRLLQFPERVELRVEDTGTGISRDQQARIFERFHRVEGAKSRSFEGSGIGLAMVLELAKLHGGDVRVSSIEGIGSTFTVSIPTGSAHLPRERLAQNAAHDPGARSQSAYSLEAAYWGTAAESAVAAEQASTPSDADRGGTSARILVADDNADMRRYLQRLLQPHWRVDVVCDGNLALAAALAEPPDLILSDVMMPGLDGVELLSALRADPRTKTVPVILLSARAGEEAMLSGLSTGADDYLVKPFSARELLTRVRTHLEMDRSRRESADALRQLLASRAKVVEELERKNAALETAYRELQTTHAQLVQAAKMASLGELVAGLAHEINNPLAFALGHLNTVQRNLDLVAEKVGSGTLLAVDQIWTRAVNRLKEMQLGLQRIRDLVIRLRAFSRLDEGEWKTVSIRECIESVLTILGHRLDGRVHVTTQFGEPDQLECYPGLLNQAILNLVSNAIDAIQDQGTVTIASGAIDDCYAITIADTGVGIPDAIRDRVLEPFFTTKPIGQGTGLGLPITYSIVKKHGGELELSPAVNGGTIAAIRLPRPRLAGEAPSA